MDSGINNKAELMLALLYAGTNEGNKDVQQSTEIEGITRLEKLLFLLKKEKNFLSNVSKENDFHFFPFKMGPWTNEVYDELDFLESLNLIKKEEEHKSNVADDAYVDELFNNAILEKYQRQDFGKEKGTKIFRLSDEGKQKAANIWRRLTDQQKADIIEVKRKFNKMNLRQFLRYVYVQYPEYTSE